MRRLRDNKLTGDEWIDRALAAKERECLINEIYGKPSDHGLFHLLIATGAMMVIQWLWFG